ncbi:MAG: zinc-dependent metalloprotease [Acidobacteriaceae bacterium]|nr:zinc-dependent metalloprotease [Acidobacteriaceae bacterium]MBV9767034.1 zinc-dependent metalloprotease [Acidobacteriaceae bacterium]
MRLLSLLLLSCCPGFPSQASVPAESAPQSLASRIAGLRKFEGFFPLYWDEHTGKMWLEIDRFNQEFLYVTALSAGVGSNELGLDRGSMNAPQVVQFERSGPRILLIESNYRFRATGADAAEHGAEIDSFARSTLWGFDVVAEQGSRVLVDATAFFLRDAARVSERLQGAKQGAYHTDATRCAFYLPLTNAFPKNTEIETTLTFTGEPTGEQIREVTPSPEAVTVREHQSFVALPDPGYKPRMQDPRAGYFSTEFLDFSAPVDQPVMKRYIARHRLVKKDPNAAISEPVDPIVYYVDPGAPAPIREALIEGASWWNQAFEAAGFRNAFQVKVLPAGVDPMDVRYNIIQWVHRSTRGWSYGNSLIDPRTAEIIKGIVSLGSLREHQDYLIFESLLAPHVQGHDDTKPLIDAVYARLRQLAAHEVGHTLGLEHNYIASTQGRASVMDYPGPWIELRQDNSFDLSKAYATGIGEWDKVAITWGYSQFSEGTDEHAALDKIITDAAQRGITFITDADSRPPGSAHPKSHLWDNGPNAVDELNRLLKIRSIALSRFGENNIEPGAPMATLEEVLVPLYFLHRYQTEAASKVLGGNEYTYALRGDGQPTTRNVPPEEQRRALKALLETIDPAVLTLPQRVLALIPPRPPGYPRTVETFPSRTGVTFDPLAAAESAADMTVALILNPQRAARLVQYHAQNSNNPGLFEVINTLVTATWRVKVPSGLEGETVRLVQYVVLRHLMALALDESSSLEVRADATNALRQLKSDVTHNYPNPYALSLIEKFEKDPKQLDLPKPVQAPPGQPIGDDDFQF